MKFPLKHPLFLSCSYYSSICFHWQIHLSYIPFAVAFIYLYRVIAPFALRLDVHVFSGGVNVCTHLILLYAISDKFYCRYYCSQRFIYIRQIEHKKSGMSTQNSTIHAHMYVHLCIYVCVYNFLTAFLHFRLLQHIRSLISMWFLIH